MSERPDDDWAKDRLIDVIPLEREHYDTGRELVPTVLRRCVCGARMLREVVRQDTLLRGGGYGGTRRVETDICPECWMVRVVEVGTERPPRELSNGRARGV
jgi:hypothetical protein